MNSNIPIAVQVIDIETSVPPPPVEADVPLEEYLQQIYALEEDAQKMKTVIAFLIILLIVAIIMVIMNKTYSC